MSRRLYVHVGPRKTATSAIQDFLQHHDNSVIVYPKAGLFGPGSHHGLVYRFFGRNPQKLNCPDIDRLFKKIAAQSKNSDRNILISSEVLELEWADTGAFIRALLPHVSQTPVEVEIILACREHFSRAASWYNHRMRSRRGPEDVSLPDEFLIKHAAEICYAPLVRRLRKTGFKVTALSYEPSRDWTDRFFRYVGFPEDQIPKIDSSKNTSLSHKVLITRIAVNKVVREKRARLKCLGAFARMPEARASSKYIFGRECAKKADQLFEEDREFLRKEYGIHLSSPDVEASENMFFIDQAEFDEIVAISRDLGAEGPRIAEFARQYLRTEPEFAA